MADSQGSASTSRRPSLAQRQSKSSDPSPETLVLEPEAFDVILGRGRSHQFHPGNMRYQALITKTYDRYFDAELHDKKKISAQIVEAVMQKGRFLKKHGKNCWVTISPEKARVKCAHALQYHHRRPSSLASSSVSGSESDSDELSQSAPTQKDDCDDTHLEKSEPVRRQSRGLNSLTFQLLAGSPLNLFGLTPDDSRQATPSIESIAEDTLSSSSSQDDSLQELLSDEIFTDTENDYLESADTKGLAFTNDYLESVVSEGPAFTNDYLESVVSEGPALTTDWRPFWNP